MNIYFLVFIACYAFLALVLAWKILSNPTQAAAEIREAFANIRIQRSINDWKEEIKRRREKTGLKILPDQAAIMVGAILLWIAVFWFLGAFKV